MLAVMEVDKQDVSSYGIITPGKVLEDNVTEILGLVEKPSVEKAPSNDAVVGRYILLINQSQSYLISLLWIQKILFD